MSQPGSQRGVSGPPGGRVQAPPLSPAVDLRVVPLTVAEGRLRVELGGGVGRWSLPCGVPQPEGNLDSEARRIVRGSAGLTERYLEQLFTSSVADEHGWTVIVSYLALIDAGEGTPADGNRAWFDASEPPPLGDDDRQVLDYAIVRLRAKIGYSTIAFHLLPPTFTLRELQTAYEAILGRSLDKRNFRRHVVAAELIECTGSKRRDGSHRPALLYRFRADHDPATYLTPSWGQERGAAEPDEDGG